MLRVYDVPLLRNMFRYPVGMIHVYDRSIHIYNRSIRIYDRPIRVYDHSIRVYDRSIRVYDHSCSRPSVVSTSSTKQLEEHNEWLMNSFHGNGFDAHS